MLDARYVERIFTRMLVRYGTAWTRMWEGVEPEAVKADWADQLSGFERNPDALKYALEHLPAERPPTVAQFKELCIRAPGPAYKALPPPKRDPKKAAQVLGEIRSAFKPKEQPLQWAYDLQERESRGEQLTPAQRVAWRDALAQAPASFRSGEFTPVPEQYLPPAMRSAT